jgi:hypothetical protein
LIAVKACVGQGNSKVGKIPTFSLPSRLTCPGASAWCIEHCYARRFERLRPFCRAGYSRNLVLTWDAERFVSTMLAEIPPDLTCFRIHVSGDMYDQSYIDNWERICLQRPRVQFCAYTRAWGVPGLRPALESLKQLRNVALFASTDITMSLPPEGWRAAFIEGDPRASGLKCSEQNGRSESCLECRYCFMSDAGNVVFRAH